jgi:poly(3-hydroxybutyrate) depolymerase
VFRQVGFFVFSGVVAPSNSINARAIVMMRQFARLGLMGVALLVVHHGAQGANIADFSDYSLRSDSGQVVLPGRLFIPPEASNDPSASRPLMVVLHGSGVAGVDNVRQITSLPDFVVDEAKRRGSFLYVPQTATTWTPSTRIDSVMTMINRAVTEQRVNANRLYATGFSIGGGGVWNLLNRNPKRFAAARAISGVAPASGFVPANLLGTAIFASHARDDPQVEMANSREVVSGILAAAGESTPNYAAAGTDLSFLISNPGLEFNRELAASAPPGSMVNFFISRSDLDVVYFEPPEGGHEGLVGYWPQAFDWMFSHSLAVPEPTPGDFNNNGAVDAADYVVWRKNLGTQSSYDTWRAHFGQPAGSGSGIIANAVVPEPATLMLLMFAAAGWCLRRGGTHRKFQKLVND